MEQKKHTLFMPAEWHKQQMVQLTWPHEGTDWNYMLAEVELCYIELAKAISAREQLLIVSPNVNKVHEMLEKAGAKMSNITFFACETNDTWARDHAFITLLGDNVPHYVDFCFNGWGRKFEASLDNAINGKLYDAGIVKGEYEDCTSFVLEGGSIESDGKGTLLTTSQCLLAPHRNQPMEREDIERYLKNTLHVERVLWLDYGNLIGDDTDGHVDTVARLAPNDTIVYMQCQDKSDKQYADLNAMEEQIKTLRTAEGKPYRMLALPSPAPIYDEDGERLPATYANFLVMNGTVLYPTYAQPANDKLAADVLKVAFPACEIVGIDCRSLIKQHGSLHCVTMQYPKNEKY